MNMPRQLIKLFAVLTVSLAPAFASAGVLGTQVTGGMYFGGGGTNYFNSNLGYVPGGCQNSGAGTATVTVVDPDAEFCFADGANVNTAQFNDGTLTVTDMVMSSASNWTMTFAFTPGVVTGIAELSDVFVNGGVNFTFANDLLTLTWAGTGSLNQTLSASYALETTSVPEPTPFALLALGMVALAAVRRTRAA